MTVYFLTFPTVHMHAYLAEDKAKFMSTNHEMCRKSCPIQQISYMIQNVRNPNFHLME